jgi:chromosome condensin MukBEF complex kleisin-like MukF subunit
MTKPMTKKDLLLLDKLLVKLQSELDRIHPLHPAYETVVKLRGTVDSLIGAQRMRALMQKT